LRIFFSNRNISCRFISSFSIILFSYFWVIFWTFSFVFIEIYCEKSWSDSLNGIFLWLWMVLVILSFSKRLTRVLQGCVTEFLKITFSWGRIWEDWWICYLFLDFSSLSQIIFLCPVFHFSLNLNFEFSHSNQINKLIIIKN